MPNRFCAICGISIDEDSPHFGMCLKCYLEENPLFELPESFSLNICIDCGKYSKKDVWYEPNYNDLVSILQEIIHKFILKTQIKNEQIEFSIEINEEDIVYSSKDLIKSVEVLVKGRLKDSKDISHQQSIKLILNHMLCRNCSNLRGGTYFVSILQLRVKDENQLDLIEQVLIEIENYVKTSFDKGHRHFISKIEEQRYGVDLYLSTNELMNHIIKFLKLSHHFVLKRSKKLVGRDTQKGRNLYRLKASIKFLPVTYNDIIIMDTEEYIIENITGNKIILKGNNNKKLIKDYSYFFNENLIIKNREANYLEENDEEIDEDELLDNETEQKFNNNIDELEKTNIDYKRIKDIDQSKKRAAIESVFDERTVFQLNKILVNGPLKRIEGVISAGKEANVYLAYNLHEKEVAIKIYKIDSNTSRWMRKYIIGDPRFKKIPNNISKIIFLWASKEFKNLKRAYKAGLRVPEPLFIKNNILIMEYIGFESIPAPVLKDIKNPKDPVNLFNEILDFIKVLYQKAKLVHGDLSEFNILYHNQSPVIIDISQAVSIQHPKAEEYLARDIKNIFQYFERLGVETPDPTEFYYDVINIDV